MMVLHGPRVKPLVAYKKIKLPTKSFSSENREIKLLN